MSSTDEDSKGRALILTAVGLLLSIVGVGLFVTLRDNSARLGALEDTGRAFLKALAAGKGEDVCAGMTRIAQSELASNQAKDNCPQAVAALVGPLDDTERDRLASSYRSRFFARDGSFGHVGVRDNPLGITELILSERDGKWLVAEIR
ncbi:hypothetical protein [Streptomyces sp. NPDC056291]|uniref:hypothetical protein n=1 Tax=Streptomyces sp. NPDC056291 TaxID=3345772 RepID=UPI0035D97644